MHLGRRLAIAWSVVIAAVLIALLLMALKLDVGLARPAPSTESVHIGETVAYLLDHGTVGTIDQPTYAALRARMAQAKGTMPNLGFQYYKGGTLWYAFDAPSLATTETNWNIRLDDTRVVNARLIVVDGENFREYDWARDDAVHFAGWGGRTPVFRFERSQIEGKTILVGVTNLAALRPSAYVETDRFTDGAELNEAVNTSLLDGGLFAVAVFLLIMGIRLRAFTLAAAAGLLIWSGIFDFGSEGYFRSVVFRDFPHFADALLYGTEPLLLTFVLLTITSYVELPRISPRVGGALVALALLAPLQGILALALAIGAPVPLFFDFFPVVIVVILAGIGSLVWFALVKRQRKAWLFLLGMLPIAGGGLLRVYSYLTPEGPAFLHAIDSYIDVVVSVMLLGLFAVFDLQSRQERLRQTAVRNEQRFRSYAEIATDSYFEADATGIVTSAAGALARDLGVVEGEPLAASLAAAAAPAQDDALGQLRQGLRRPQAVRDIELATAGNAGRSLWVSVNLGPHTPTGGELPGVRGTLVDVTERVERRNREARQATLSALGQLAGGVAHEVNNLLHPIVNLARRVRDRTTDAESQHLLDLVVSSGQHAGEIVAGVLNAFNPATPPGPVRPMGPALAEALLAVRATLPAGVQLRETIDLQADLPVLPGEMLQVASNLVSNAVRAMDGHGTIAVALAVDAAGITQLSFKDDGPGMPEAIRGHATEPFVTGRSGGTGLGLSIVAGIVQKWGGDLRIVSAPGAGTTISISIAAPN